MSLHTDIADAIKDAMRAKDSARLEVLRGVKTAFTNELVATKRTPQDSLNDEEAIGVVMRLAKQRKESIAQFTEGGRQDLAAKEALELSILEEYLPEMMSRDDIQAFVKSALEKMGGADKSNMGMLMGSLMKDLKGKADGTLVKEALQEILG